MAANNLGRISSERSKQCLDNFRANLKFKVNDDELRYSCFQLTEALKNEAQLHIKQQNYQLAENKYTTLLNILDTLVRDRPRLRILSATEQAKIWANRSYVRCKLEKYQDAFGDAEASIDLDANYLKGYWRAAQALKGLTFHAKAAFFLMTGLNTIDAETSDQFVYFTVELAVVISQIRGSEVEKFDINFPRQIVLTDNPNVWMKIVQNLCDNNEYEAFAILTTGVCDRCQLTTSPLHHHINHLELSFRSVNIGAMLKYLADKEGVKSWHLKLAEFVARKGADILTVQDSFKEPFAIVMVTLSVGGEHPSFMSLAWEKLSVVDYDQKDSRGNSPFHVLAKHNKSAKQTSEIICRDLLAHGVVVSDPDLAGKYAQHYVPPHTLVHKLLHDAMSKPGEGVLKRLEKIRELGKLALDQKKYDEAIRVYQSALTITSKFNALNKEAAIFHSNLAAVSMSKESYAEALVHAQNSLKADPGFSKGYYRKGQALSKMGNYQGACEAFILGFSGVSEETERLIFATETVKILPYIPDAQPGLVKKMKDMFNKVWPKMLETLTQKGMWSQVASLVFGPPFDHNGKNFQDGRGLMWKNDAHTATLSTIYEAIKTREVNAPAIVIYLLQHGAGPITLAVHEHDSFFHAAVRFCVQTEDTQLLKYLIQVNPVQMPERIRDSEDRTLLHTLCVECEKQQKVGATPVEIAKILLEKNVDLTVRDRYKRCAADYLLQVCELKKFLAVVAALQSKKSAGNKFDKTEGGLGANWQELKEKGNDLFKKGQYQEAIQLYTQAIEKLEQQMQSSYGVLEKEDGRNLAILYGNRAECWYKQGHLDKFLDDARKSVDADGSWFRGHYRVGRAFKEQGKGKVAIRAFANALQALGEKPDEDMACKILVDLVETASEQKEYQESSFNNLPAYLFTLWPKVAYQFIVSKKWNLAEFVFKKCQNPPKDQYNISLRPFCDKTLLENQKWICGMLLWFLASGADHTTLKFHEGDTYFHATINIIVLSGSYVSNRQPPLSLEAQSLLELVVTLRVCPNRELNITDSKGNTVLHLVASLKEADLLRAFLAKYLLEVGVDVMVENRDRKRAVDLTSLTDVLRNLLQAYMNKHITIEKMKDQASQIRREEQKQAAEKVKEKTTSSVANSSLSCDACEKKWQKVTEFQKKDRTEKVFSNLVEITNCKINAKAHKDLTNRAVERIATLLSYSSTVPQVVCKMNAKKFKEMLVLMTKSHGWKHLSALVTMFRQSKGLQSLHDFARDMSLIDLIKDRSFDGNEAAKLDLLELLVSNGILMEPESSSKILEEAVRNSEWKLAARLLELGANPVGLMVQSPGSTPYHVALNVALLKRNSIGYFRLLEKVKEVYDTKKDILPYFDVSCQDQAGNSLLHIVAQQVPFTAHVDRAIKLLHEWNVRPDLRNKRHQLAIDCLTSAQDPRAQYLLVPDSKDSSEPSAGKVTADSMAPQASKVAKPKASKPKVNTERLIGSLGATFQSQVDTVERILSSWSPQDNNLDESDDSGSDEDRDMSDDEAGRLDEQEEAGFKEIGSAPATSRLNVDVKTFDNLEWDVECTEEVWSALKYRKAKVKREEDQQARLKKDNLPFDLKQLVVAKIHQLASGDWETSVLERVSETPDSLQLFKISLPQRVCVLWELALAFSPRMSEHTDKIVQDESEPRAGRALKVYSELIRVWCIVRRQSQLQESVQKIVSSHQRGKDCIIQKILKPLGGHQTNKASTKKRLPVLYVEDKSQTEANQDIELHRKLFPPASSHRNEFHVLKFYTFSSSMVQAILSSSDTDIDFPFRVTDIEHAVIHLKALAPLLLLGRSGTGKTTCCLYRLWSMFLHYWDRAIPAGCTRLLPRPTSSGQLTETEETGENQAESNKTDVASKGPEVTNSVADCRSSSTDCPDFEDVQSGSEDGEEDFYEDSSGVLFDHLHQLFVTKNPNLCTEVQKNFTKLCNATEETLRQTIQLNTSLPNTLQDVSDFCYPLFMTSRQLLLMLDASIYGEPFFPRDEDLALKVEIPGWGTQEDIFNIPPLEHDDLLDQDGGDGDNNNQAGLRRAPALGGRAELKTFARRECTYEVFAYEVWPKIAKKAEIDCHPSLVWTEIMSFIKGSYESLHTDKGYLDEAEYINLGRKRAPNFSGNRSNIYALFTKYLLYKQKFSLFDEADIVYKLYCRLRQMKFHPWVLHEIYVDETQDFTQAELALVVSISSDPNKMFLTGDTAQSIMRGISFRFSDLRSLFFYAKKSAKQNERHLSSLKVPEKVHQLTHNYRSHTGILSLASSVLDILNDLFPDSFDLLEKDQGMFSGPKPIIIESSSPGDLALLLTGSKRETSHIEFGAHQAVLVVSEEAKVHLPKELSAGIVLTIFESKGLEFDDVLLYNFFKDSYAKKEWRVVTDFLQRKTVKKEDSTTVNPDSLLEIDAEFLEHSAKSRPLKFDANQHKVLNAELKHLYTAITRARVNVWIFDEDDEKRAPMFEYFKARGLVKCMGSQECENVNEAIMFADKSTTKEWRQAGDKFMHQKLYNVAAKCYRLAEKPGKEKLALAYQTALEASRMRNQPKAMREKYFRAGQQFVECRDLHRAAVCFQNALTFDLSALAFDKIGKFEEAASQYMRAHRWADASRCWEQISMYGRAIRVFVDNELFEEAITCRKRYDKKIKELKKSGVPVPLIMIENRPNDLHSKEKLLFRLADFYHQHKNKDKAVATIKRSRKVEDQVVFLQERGYLKDAAEILGKNGKTELAAQLLLKSGETSEALKYAQDGLHKQLTGFIYLILARKHEAEDSDSAVAISNAGKAKVIYTELNDLCGVGQAKLLLGKLTKDEELIKEASRSFAAVKPQKNDAGMLECFNASSSMRDPTTVQECQNIVHYISISFDMLKVLNKQDTTNKGRYQQFLTFYGLELDSLKETEVALYPRQYPTCRIFLKTSMVDERRKLETNATLTYKEKILMDKAQVEADLQNYLVGLVQNWADKAHKWLKEQSFAHFPCNRFQVGQVCSAECRYLHRPYQSGPEEMNVLNHLICEVELDSHLKELVKFSLPSQTDQCLRKAIDDRWKLAEKIIHFILPSYPSVKRSDHSFVFRIMKQLQRSKVPSYMTRHFLHLWEFPGRVGRGKSEDRLKERCKTTDWIVQSHFFSRLLKCNMNVEDMVGSLQDELNKKQPKWLGKRNKYALFLEWYTEPNGERKVAIEAIGVRFLQSFNTLTNKNNPFEAIFPFTKMMSAFGSRNNPFLMPKMDHFIFWIEFYFTLSWIFIAKGKQQKAGPGSKVQFYMTNSSLAGLHLPSVCMESSTEASSLLQLVAKDDFEKYKRIDHILNRQSFLSNFLVGFNEYSDFSFIGHANELCQQNDPKFSLAERIVILAALVLLNIACDFVKNLYEVPIRREIYKLKVTDAMPLRLATLIKSLQKASNYSEVMIAVLNYFQQQKHGTLFLCHWSGQEGNPLYYFQATSAHAPALTFFEVNIMEEVARSIKTSERQAFQDKDSPPKSSDMTEEDLREFQMKVEARKEEEKKNEAARKIVHCVRVFIMRKNLARKSYIQYEQEERFLPYTIGNNACGLCSVELVASEDYLDTVNEEAVTREQHLNDRSHFDNLRNMLAFKNVYVSKIHQRYQHIRKIVLHAIKKLEPLAIYKEIELEASKITDALKSFESTLDDIFNNRKWLDINVMMERFKSLYHCFEENYRSVKPCYDEFMRQSSSNQPQDVNRAVDEVTNRQDELRALPEDDNFEYKSNRRGHYGRPYKRNLPPRLRKKYGYSS